MMKKLLICVLALCALLISAGCSDKTTVVKVFDTYRIERTENNDHYIVASIDSNEPLNDPSDEMLGITFKSVDEFVEAMTGGGLSETQIAHAHRVFKKDDDGRIKMLDVSKIHIPKLNDDTECTGVYWTGEDYAYSLLNKAEEMPFMISCCTHDSFESRKSFREKELFENNSREITSQTINDGGDRVYFTKTGKCEEKEVVYDYETDNFRCTVFEKYTIKWTDPDYHPWEPSKDAPLSLHVFAESDNFCYVLTVYHLKERPTRENINELLSVMI